MSQVTRRLENSMSSTSFFSRAGKASLSRFKILLDKEKILKGELLHSMPRRQKSDKILSHAEIKNLVSQELENFKAVIKT